MAHLIENMIYRGEKPWHGLGTEFTDNLTVKEALDLAKLSGWNLELKQLFFRDNAGNQVPVDRAAVVRQDGAIVGDSVGLGFRPIQIEDAFSVFDPFVQAGCLIETAGSINGGRRVWMLARLNRPDSVIVSGADDRVSKYLMCAMGHDGSLSFRIGYTPIRVVCNNTLQMALGKGKTHHVKVKHTSNAAKSIEAIKEEISKIDANFEKTADIFRALAQINIKNDKQIKEYIKQVFGQKDKDHQEVTQPNESGTDLLSALLNKDHSSTVSPSIVTTNDWEHTCPPERKSRVEDDIMRLFHHGTGNDVQGVAGTAWALYNAVTHYNTHERGRDSESRLNSNWFQPQGPVAMALPTAIDMFLNNNA